MAETSSDFQIGEWRISPKLNRVASKDRSVRLKHKSMEVLCVLAKANGEPVTREEFMDAVWPRMVVTDDVLTQSIAEMRRAFEDDARNPSVIETIPRVGFRLIVPVSPVAEDGPLKTSFFAKPAPVAASLIALAAIVLFFLNNDVVERNQVLSIDEQPSIVVLPFDNIGGDLENEYFTEGLTQDIRTLLGRISGLRVIGRTSSQVFKSTGEDVRVIGETLGVHAVLEGSVRKSGEQIRVTAELIDVADGTQIWSDSYDRRLTELFAVQDDVASAIIESLEIHVGQAPTRGQPTSSGGAYTYYLQAKAAANANDLVEAKRLAEAALAIDPQFAEAQEMLAYISWYEPRSFFHPETGQQELLINAAAALAMDPELPLANAFFEGTRIDGYSFYKEFVAYENAAKALPNNPLVLTTYFYYLLQAGYFGEATAVATQQVQIEPLAAVPYINRFNAYQAAGRFDEAESALDKVQELRGGVASWQKGDVYMSRGEYESAAAIFDAYNEDEGIYTHIDIGEIIVAVRQAEDGERYLDQVIDEILNNVPDYDTFSWWQGLTRWYLFFGYIDRYVDMTIERRPELPVWTGTQSLIYWATIYRHTGFTAHPKYPEIAERAGLTEVWERRGPPDHCRKVGTEWICG